MARHFFRCLDCLSVAAVDNPVPDRGWRQRYTIECGACGGLLDHMGEVSGRSLIQRRTGCPCDGRCTGAIGPNCECSCGGENHGTGRLVEIIKGVGPVPVAKIKLCDEAKKIAEEWRAAKRNIEAAIVEIVDDGRWLPESEFNRLRQFRSVLWECKMARSHKGRMQKAARLFPSISKADSNFALGCLRLTNSISVLAAPRPPSTASAAGRSLRMKGMKMTETKTVRHAGYGVNIVGPPVLVDEMLADLSKLQAARGDVIDLLNVLKQCREALALGEPRKGNGCFDLESWADLERAADAAIARAEGGAA